MAVCVVCGTLCGLAGTPKEWRVPHDNEIPMNMRELPETVRKQELSQDYDVVCANMVCLERLETWKQQRRTNMGELWRLSGPLQGKKLAPGRKGTRLW